MTDDDPQRRALEAVRSLGVPHTVIRHGPVRSLAEAAEARGVEPADVVKTLVVRRADDDYVLVLVPGDRQLHWPRLRAVLGVSRATMPTAKEATAVTGYERGTITPFGTTRPWPVVADERLLGRTVTLGAGAHGVAVAVAADEALGVLAATVADVSEPIDPQPGVADGPAPTAVVTLRSLGPDDWRTWRPLRQAALADAPEAFGTPLADWVGDGDREDRWRDRLARPGTHLVAEVDGRPVGMASGVPVDDVPDAVAVISLWVHPSARGRGVADVLLQTIESWGRAEGATRVVLAVAAGNGPAESVYRRHGFVPAPDDPAAAAVADGCEVLLAKPLR